MSVTSMNSRMAMAEKLSIPQLQQAIKAGSVPAYVGIPLLQEKVKMQRAMQAQMQQAPQSEGTIADQVMREAEMEGGIEQLPSNLPLYDTDEVYSEMGEEREYARGGIVALAEGGTGEEGPQPRSLPETTYMYDAKPFKEDPAYRAFVQDGGLNGDLRYDTFLELGNPVRSSQFEPPKELSDEEIATLKQSEQDRERARLLKEEALAGVKDVGGVALRTLGTGADYLARGANALGATIPRPPAEYTLNRSDQSLMPNREALLAAREQEAQNIQAEQPYYTESDTERMRYSDAAREIMGDTQPPAKSAPSAPPMYTGESSAGYGTSRAAPTRGQAPAAGGRGQAAPGGVASLPAGRGAAGAPATLKAAEKAADSDSPQSAPASQALSMLDKYVAMLEKSGQDVDRDKKEALYMALIQGGLAAAGGTSPNALANIAAGMVPAMQGYQQALAGIKKDERARLEKLMAAGLKKEEFLLQAKKLGIEEKKAEAMANYYNARAATAGTSAGGDGRNERAINAAYNSATGAFNRATTDIDKQIQAEMNKPAYMYGDKSPSLATQKKEIQTRIDALNQRKSRVEQQYYSYVRNNLGIDIPDFSGGAGGVPTVSSQAEYAKLPPGTQYRDPNGVLRTKG